MKLDENENKIYRLTKDSKSMKLVAFVRQRSALLFGYRSFLPVRDSPE
jgi:hypothetical protein